MTECLKYGRYPSKFFSNIIWLHSSATLWRLVIIPFYRGINCAHRCMGRQLSMGLSCSCTSCEQRKWLPFFQTVFYFILFFFFQRLFIFGTERDRAWTEEGQRERETQNRKQPPGSEPSAQSLTRGLNSRTGRSWPGWSRMLNRLRHPGAPMEQF